MKDDISLAYNQELNRAWDKLTKMEPFTTDEYRPPRFRLSSSPFCQLRFIYNWYDFLSSGKNDYWDYGSDFYTNIGTAIHSVLQKWIPRVNPGIYLGNWKCPSCNNTLYAVTGPKFCTNCNKWMIYDEFTFIEKPGFSGHCDGIMLLNKSLLKTLKITETNTEPMDKYIRKCKSPLNAVVVEYKSAGSFKAKKITSPTPNNKAQAMMYVTCANHKMKELNLNIRVIGSVVKYISRDHFSTSSNDFFLPVKDTVFFDMNKDIVRSVYKSIKYDDVSHILELPLPCKGKFKKLYQECGYSESCSSLKKHIKSMFKDTKRNIKKDFLFLKSLGDNR